MDESIDEEASAAAAAADLPALSCRFIMYECVRAPATKWESEGERERARGKKLYVCSFFSRADRNSTRTRRVVRSMELAQAPCAALLPVLCSLRRRTMCEP